MPVADYRLYRTILDTDGPDTDWKVGPALPAAAQQFRLGHVNTRPPAGLWIMAKVYNSSDVLLTGAGVTFAFDTYSIAGDAPVKHSVQAVAEPYQGYHASDVGLGAFALRVYGVTGLGAGDRMEIWIRETY